MNKYKVAVYAICKDEEKFIKRWVNSMNEADEIYVLDTGSVPGSPVVTVPIVNVGVSPVAPVGPVGPISPVGPVGPVGPISPVRPVGPIGPVAPVGPVGPVAPTRPWIPCKP